MTEATPILRCAICGEETTHNRESSLYGSVHRHGPTGHEFKPNPEGVKVHETAAKIVSALEDTVEQLDPTAEWSRVQAQVFPLGYTGDETLEDLQEKALSYLISRCGEVHSPADEKALRAECERIMAGVKA